MLIQKYSIFILIVLFIAFIYINLRLLMPSIRKKNIGTRMYLVLVIIICVIVVPLLGKGYFQRQRKVSASSSNIYNIDLKNDLKAIKQKLDVKGNVKIDNFNVSFEESGMIKSLEFRFLVRENNGVVIYNVDLSPNKEEYAIKPQRVKQWLQYDRLINEEQFFYALSHLNIKEVKPKQEYPYYSMRCSGEYQQWAMTEWNNFFITDSGLKKIEDNKAPLDAYLFWFFGNKKVGEGHYTSDGSIGYYLSR